MTSRLPKQMLRLVTESSRFFIAWSQPMRRFGSHWQHLSIIQITNAGEKFCRSSSGCHAEERLRPALKEPGREFNFAAFRKNL